MAILVTGGAGYIGSHTIIELVNMDYQVVVVDNFSNGSPEAIKRISKITGKDIKTYNIDILDKKGLDQVFEENNFQSVVHFAGLKAVGESVTVPLEYYQNNIAGTLNLCEVMKKHHVKNLVFSSSATVYGIPETVPISENAPLRATNPYGRTKLMIEEILNDLCDSDDSWSISILRYFNPIGAHSSGMIGEDPAGIPNNLVPYITKVAVGELEEVKIFGSDYPTKDGTGIRDYIHVMDLAAGHLKALEKNMMKTGIDTYNLGTGNGYSVLDIIDAFEETCGRKIPYRITERRPGDIAVCYANPSKAEKELNWTAKRGMKEMCMDSWRWQSNNLGGYKRESKILVEISSSFSKRNEDFLIKQN